jgi:hypothetical protein
MSARINEILLSTLDVDRFGQIGMSFHVYPERSNEGTRNSFGNAALYLDGSSIRNI